MMAGSAAKRVAAVAWCATVYRLLLLASLFFADEATSISTTKTSILRLSASMSLGLEVGLTLAMLEGLLNTGFVDLVTSCLALGPPGVVRLN